MKQQLIKVTVVRKNWLRGVTNSALMIPDGRRCCLGFAGQACGIADHAMQNVGTPLGVPYREQRWPDGVLTSDGNSDAIQYLISINDNPSTDDASKEREIRIHGPEAGFDFEFVDE